MIPEETVQRVLEATDIVDLIGSFITLRRDGAGWKGCCPFHKEKSGSFNVNPVKRFYHCFGCGASGDAIKFLQEHKGLQFGEAVKALAGPRGITVEENARPRRLDRSEFTYNDPDPTPAQPAPKRAEAPVDGFKPRRRPRGGEETVAVAFDWDACVNAFSAEHVSKLAEWRGYSREFVEWMSREKLVGLHRGNFAIPVHDSTGAVVRCHYRLDDGRWMYFPTDGETAPLVIGNPADAGHTLAFESQWDAFAVLDQLGFHEDPTAYSAIITRGATSNTDFRGYEVPTIVAIPQNDPESKRSKKTGLTPAEDWLVKIRESRHSSTRVVVGKVPTDWKDANDWIRDGKADRRAVRRAVIEEAQNPLLAGFRTASEIRKFEVRDDRNSLIGYKRRYLGRGGSLIIVGPSGIGKSTLTTLMAVCWAAGNPWFGVEPRHPLKVLIIQAENDTGDMREMLDGAFESLGSDLSPSDIARAEANLLLRHETERTGEAFCKWLEEVIRETSAEVVFVDPLLSYIGDDISQQKVCSQFLRTWLQPVLARTGALIVFSHHTGKTSSDASSRSHWTHSDQAYLGLGSSELTNWARSVATLVPASKDSTVFRFSIAKRGGRAGMISRFADSPVKTLFLAHAEKGLGWREVEQPEPDPKKTGGRKRLISESDVLKALGGPSLMTNKDDLVSMLTATFSLKDPKTVRTLVSRLLASRRIEVAKTESRPGGGAPIQYLRQLP